MEKRVGGPTEVCNANKKARLSTDEERPRVESTVKGTVSETLTITLLNIENLKGVKGNNVQAIVRVEFGDKVLGESGKLECSADSPSEINYTAHLTFSSDDSLALDDLASKPLVCTVVEVLPQEKKQKEEKTVVLGQCSVDLAPLLTGEVKQKVKMQVLPTTGSPMENLPPDHPKPELEIQLSVNESIFKGFHAEETNVINITAESLYSPPESWNMSPGYNYVAATAVPLAGEKESTVVFTGGQIKPSFDKEMPNKGKKWAMPGSAQGAAIYIGDKTTEYEVRQTARVEVNSKRTSGLANPGKNLCYANSCMQMLSHIPGFCDYFLRSAADSTNSAGVVTREFANLMKRMWSGHSDVTAEDLKEVIAKSYPEFAGNYQEDVVEFMQSLLTKLHAELLSEFDETAFDSLVECNPEMLPEDGWWVNYLFENWTVVARNIYGLGMTTVTCNKCQSSSSIYEPYAILPLPVVQSTGVQQLADCIANYLAVDNLYRMCSVCKESQLASVKLELWNLPEILVLQLKRFVSSKKKIQTVVKYPIRLLVRSGNRAVPTAYELISVVTHCGSQIATGHYMSVVRDGEAWHLYDDQRVSCVTENNAIAREAYVLMYRRCRDSAQSGFCAADEEMATEDFTRDDNVGKSRDGSRTDNEAVQREEEAVKLDGHSVAQMKELKEISEKHVFQANVDRMMKLIINCLYQSKEIFLRELILNASDALDKIRFLSLKEKSALDATEDLVIRIKADEENHVLHVTDTGVGMTKDELVKNLGTIAKSGTSEFLSKLGEASPQQETSDLIGQFGVGFYSSFFVADRVVVTSKSNDDDQYIWDSDAASFSVAKDPRGNTLGRGTTVSLHLKEEAHENLEQHKIKDLVKKYSQFINFPIYLWESKVEKVEEPAEDDDEEKKAEDVDRDEDDDAKVEEEDEAKKPKKKEVEKTVWDWVLINENKPIWTKKPADVTEEEYNEFYKSFLRDHEDPMAKTHFTAEGEVTFKSILYIPKTSPPDMFQNYGKKVDYIRMFVRRVFITDNFEDMMPKYLSFVRGIVDSDDLPLNVSRETLQQHKLLKVIKKKLVRKTLDMIKKISDDDYKTFWKEYSTNIKLGVMEDHLNRKRLAKLLRFISSNSDTESTSLAEYVERMKEKQEHIYFIAGSSRMEVEKSPFVERLLKKGYEVLYLVEAVDEYCIQSLPEFEGKKFQNAAKEGLKLDDSEKSKQRKETLEKEFEPLLTWMIDDALKDQIEKAVITERLTTSPCALVASSFGWSGNMERIMRAQAYQKTNDPNNQYYAPQKKTLELNPRHPLIKKLKNRVENNKDDQTTKDLVIVLFETATLRSGFALADTSEFAGRVERMLQLSMDISLDEKIDDEPEEEEAGEDEDKDDDSKEEDEDMDEDDKSKEDKDEEEEKKHLHDEGEL